jgi:hypothetical protein
VSRFAPTARNLGKDAYASRKTKRLEGNLTEKNKLLAEIGLSCFEA